MQGRSAKKGCRLEVVGCRRLQLPPSNFHLALKRFPEIQATGQHPQQNRSFDDSLVETGKRGVEIGDEQGYK